MGIPCEVIQDLLPLYMDGVCSGSSTEMVKAHLDSCPQCREFLRKLGAHTSEDILRQEKDGVLSRHGRKVRQKRIRAVCLSVMLTLAVIFACVALWPVSLDYGTSEIYSRQDMEQAISIIREEFNSWRGCKLYSISYTSDSLCSEELEYCNTLAKDGVIYDECIVFTTQFRSPLLGGGAWIANFRYDWSWYLARTEGGDWELLTWGVP